MRSWRITVTKMLKCTILLLLVCCLVESSVSNDIHAHLNDVDSDPEMEKYLREAIENFRESMRDGIDAIHMPPLDPLELSNLDVNVNENLATMNLKIQKISIHRLSLFNITDLKPNLEKFYLAINLTLPELSIIGHYDLNGMLLKIFPLYGNGSFEINATEVFIAGRGRLHFTNETIQMGLLKLDLSWHHISVNLENFLKGGDFSDVLQRVVPGVGKDVFNAYKPQVLDKLECALTNKINEKLNDPLVKDIIKGILPDEYE